MACFAPYTGFRSRTPNLKTGKFPIVWTKEKSIGDSMEIPCRKCIGCLEDRIQDWAIRINHEASLYDDNCFITLTYADKFLKKDYSLKIRDAQLFLKRLRKKYRGRKIRYFMAGEYGKQTARPHYHMILFNLEFQDKQAWRLTDKNYQVYRSPILETIWTAGHSEIGSVTLGSARYLASYLMKGKIKGDPKTDQYIKINYYTGEIETITPEFQTMSTNKGIGHGWYKKFKSDLYPDDYVVLEGKKYRIPEYYDRLYEVEEPEKYQKIQKQRRIEAKKREENKTEDRLAIRERIKILTHNCENRSL